MILDTLSDSVKNGSSSCYSEIASHCRLLLTQESLHVYVLVQLDRTFIKNHLHASAFLQMNIDFFKEKLIKIPKYHPIPRVKSSGVTVIPLLDAVIRNNENNVQHTNKTLSLLPSLEHNSLSWDSTESVLSLGSHYLLKCGLTNPNDFCSGEIGIITAASTITMESHLGKA